MAKPDKYTTKIDYYRPIYVMTIDAKTLFKTLAKQIEKYVKMTIHHTNWDFYRMQSLFSICKSISVIHNIKRRNYFKNHLNRGRKTI